METDLAAYPRCCNSMCITAQFSVALFAWSASVVYVSITTVLHQTWPLGQSLLTARLFRSEGRYQRIGPLTILAFLVAVAGVALVALSHAGDLDFSNVGEYITNAPFSVAGGVGLALSAAGLVSLNSFGFRWGADLAGGLPPDDKHDTASLEVFGVVVGLVICSSFAILGMSLIGFARNEPVVPGSLWVALVGGPLIGAGGNILWRWGILMTTSLKIQVIAYFTPLLSLLWLYLLSLVGDVDGGLLFGGAVVIVIANLIVWAEGRQQGESPTSVRDQPREPKDVHELVAGGKRVLAVDCGRSPSPVYVREGNKELFYVRTGPATTELTVSETVEYINRRF